MRRSRPDYMALDHNDPTLEADSSWAFTVRLRRSALQSDFS